MQLHDAFVNVVLVIASVYTAHANEVIGGAPAHDSAPSSPDRSGPCADQKEFPAPPKMVDVSQIEGIEVDLKYNSPENFVGSRLYCDLGKKKAYNLRRAYLDEDCARNLRAAAASIKNSHKIRVYDAFRPNSVQAQMRLWAEKEHGEKAGLYVGKAYDPKRENPDKVSMHLRGLAVDLTVVPTRERRPKDLDKSGALNMGGAFDDFRSCASMKPKEEDHCGLTGQHHRNRNFLRQTMIKAGFRPYDNEWWHFECGDKNSATDVANHPVPTDPE